MVLSIHMYVCMCCYIYMSFGSGFLAHPPGHPSIFWGLAGAVGETEGTYIEGAIGGARGGQKEP